MARYDRRDRVNVYLGTEQRSALRALALQAGASESDLIRKAVAHLLRNQDFFVPPVSRETRVLLSRESEAVA